MTFQLHSMMKILLGTLIFCLTATISYAADPVSQVTVIKTDNPAAYITKLAEGKALLKKLNSKGEMRVWRATMAGRSSGTISVVVEWPDMTTFAVDGEKVLNSPEWTQWVSSLSSMRTITNVSLYSEIIVN